ncbi:unnamed protein product [Ostreobium quekettii]|uniref:Uncharacterized protein n=1 Tax=Ostreobium quekettii TaxID=121088 RepID=A0A8S1J9W6_9CHLO|nr:unnamed protein product [Ostreobium quekettii]
MCSNAMGTGVIWIAQRHRLLPQLSMYVAWHVGSVPGYDHPPKERASVPSYTHGLPCHVAMFFTLVALGLASKKYGGISNLWAAAPVSGPPKCIEGLRQDMASRRDECHRAVAGTAEGSSRCFAPHDQHFVAFAWILKALKE